MGLNLICYAKIASSQCVSKLQVFCNRPEMYNIIPEFSQLYVIVNRLCLIQSTAAVSNILIRLSYIETLLLNSYKIIVSRQYLRKSANCNFPLRYT